MELGSEEDPDLGRRWVVSSRSVTEEEKPHLDDYTAGCDVGIDCLADSDDTSLN